MLSLFQKIFYEGSVVLSLIVGSITLGSAGMLGVKYTTRETEKHKQLENSNLTFIYVGLGIILFINFISFWVMFCPTATDSVEINRSIQLRAIGIFGASTMGLFPLVYMLKLYHLDPEGEYKDIPFTTNVMVFVTALIALVLTVYVVIKAVTAGNEVVSQVGVF